MLSEAGVEEKRLLSRRSVLRASALGGAGLAAAALIGCGSKKKDEKAATTAGEKPAATAAAAQLPGVDVGGKRIPFNFPEPAGKTPKDGGTLNVGATWDVSTFDPSKSAAGGTVTVPNAVSDRLLGFKRGATADPFKLELVSELAQLWERTPDGMSYTFKLAPNVKWQNVAPLNGRPFTSADVKFAYERYQKEGVHRPYFTNVKSIEAPDASTVKITLNKPQPDFLVPLASRYLTMHAKEMVDSGEIDKKPVGTGPLIFKSASQGQGVSLVKNPDYWAGKVHVDGVEFKVMTDATTRLAAFRAKQIDFGYSVGDTANDLEAIMKSTPDVQATSTSPVNATFAISFNLTNPKWQDVRIRRAISMAIDRNELIQVVYQGFAKSLPTFPWIFTLDKEPTAESGALGKWWKTDRNEAKSLLQAAGQADLAIPMVYYNYSDSSNSRPNQVLVDQFRQVGIKLDAKAADYTEFNSQWVGAKFADVADGWAAQGFDTDNFFYQHMRSDSPGNRWRINDPEIDKWADEQRVELDPAKRREILKKIWDKELDQMYRVEKPAPIGFTTYGAALRGFRSVGVFGANSYYYDWGAQMKDIWLDK